LSTLHEDLEVNKEVMDLPGLPIYDDVTSTLGILEQEDVMAVTTICMGKSVIFSFHTRGLIWCVGHPGVVLDRNFGHYNGIEDYPRAIAGNLWIDMSVDSKKRAALSLMDDNEERPKKCAKTEDGSGTE
jgi:hypothetical protein